MGRRSWYHQMVPVKITPPAGSSWAEAVLAPCCWPRGLLTPAPLSHQPWVLSDCLWGYGYPQTPQPDLYSWPWNPTLDQWQLWGTGLPNTLPIWATFPSQQAASPTVRLTTHFIHTHKPEVSPKPTPAPCTHSSAHPATSHIFWESLLFKILKYK